MVTVLFCDLVGFTARADRADPEEVKGTLRPFHASVQREIERHGGWVAEFLGDGVLAIFGAPIAHEDDPERAIRASLRIQASIEDLNRAHPTLALTARVGIETGEAVVSYALGPQIGGNVIGDVVNTASRLQSVAPPGGIVVGEATYRATASEFRFRELPPVEVKGKAEPLAIWQPLEPASRLPEDTRRRIGTPLVGREAEMRTLERLLVRTVRDGMPGFVVVTGEAGVGKTRLIAELANVADALPEFVRWRQGRPLPYGEGVAFSALADVVKAEAGILESDPAETTREKLRTSLERTSADGAERETLLRALAPLLGLPTEPVEDDQGWGGWGVGDGDRAQVFNDWSRYLELLTVDHPLVLVFEDLHQASGPFLDLIDHLLDWSSGGPMLVLAVGRPELRERRPQWLAWTGATHVEVAPLPQEQIRTVVDGLLGEVPIAPEKVQEAIDRSEGIPLYAEEFARMFRERAVTPSSGDPESPVPTSLRSLLAARLDGLRSDERALLQDASIMGRAFWSGALEAMAGAERGRLDTVLEGLVEREILRRVRPSTVEGQQEFSFSHALVRDVAYARIPRMVRAGKHRSVAEWIERIAGDRVADRAEALAQHFAQAVSLARASGDAATAEELLEPTVKYVRMAAERAMGFDAVRGHRLYMRALSLLPEGHPDRARTLRDAGVMATALGHYEEAERFLRDALAEYQERDDQVGRADVLIAFSRLMFERGETESVGPLLDVALGLLEVREPGTVLARAYTRHAGFLLVSGDYEGALRRAGQGLALARELHMGREEILAMNYVGAARTLLGGREGFDVLRDAITRGHELGIGPETAIAMNNLAENLRLFDGPAAALEVWEEMVVFCSGRGLSSLFGWARMGLIVALFDLGRWDDILALEPEIDAWDRAHGVSPLGTLERMFAAWIALRRGDLQQALARTSDLIPRVERIAFDEYEAPAAVLLAEISLGRGRVAEAKVMLDRFERASAMDRLFRTTPLPVVARLLAEMGDLDRLRRLLGDLPEARVTRERLSIESARGVLAEAEGDLVGAAEIYRHAADEWRVYGMPLEVGHLLLGLARCELALGDREGAASSAAAAAELYGELSAVPAMAAAQRVLAEARGA